MPQTVWSAVAQDITDTPRRRWEFFRSQRAYPFNQIPAGALQTARRQAAAITFSAPPPISGTQWQSLGPEGIPISLQSTGRLVAIAVDPTDSNIIYVGGAQGGVWKTVDGGTSWTPMTDGECSLAMGSIAIDPVNPNIIYAGTGEQHFSGDSYYGCGVLRSDDGGSTWVSLGTTIFRTSSGGAKIARVVIDPATAGSSTATTVLVASDFGLFRSTNSGVSWTEVLGGIATDLVQDPVTPAIHFAAVRSDGVYRSTNGGLTWTRQSTGLPTTDVARINLALAPSDPATLYASIQRSSAGDLLGIYKTTNGGSLWIASVASGASCSTQCWYDMTLAVHPSSADTVYFGGVSLFKSSNGGATFTSVTNGVHVDQHILMFDPNDANTLYAGNDGGIYRTTNGAASWTTLNTNLALTQFYSGVSLHPTDPTFILAGTQDNGTLSYRGAPIWTAEFGGDGGYTAIDRNDPTIQYLETQWTAGSGFSGPRRSDGLGFARKVNGIDINESALFIPPLVMDPTNSSILYFGTSRLYRTTNRGDIWNAFNLSLTGGDVVSAIAAADTSTIYAGSSGGAVNVTLDGGATWLNRDAGLPQRFVTDLAVDRTNPQVAYVVFSGFLTNHVYRTINGGVTWQSIDGNLPDAPVNAVLLDPGNPAGLFVGTDLGVYVTTNGGVTWAPFNNGLPNVAVFDLVYNAETGTLAAATHGRGMFGLQMATAIFLEVTPVSRADTSRDNSTELIPDSVRVVVGGTGGSAVSWSATTSPGGWLTLTNATGVGIGSMNWTRDPSGLPVGTYVDTVTVTAVGAVGSPAQIVDTLVVLQFINLALAPTSRSAVTQEDSETPTLDSASVVLTGTDPASAAWTATNVGGWNTVTTASGTGPGTVRWSRDATGLAAGIHVDTITVTSVGAIGSPAIVVDTLTVLGALAISVTPTSRSHMAFARDVELQLDSADVMPTGFGSDAETWTATGGSSPWLTLTAASGQGAGAIMWSVDPTGLPPEIYVDTITVSLPGAAAPALLLDTLRILSVPITIGEAADALLNATNVTSAQSDYLDSRGNADGIYNLGDFLALLDRLTTAANVISTTPVSPASVGVKLEPDSTSAGRRPR